MLVFHDHPSTAVAIIDCSGKMVPTQHRQCPEWRGSSGLHVSGPLWTTLDELALHHAEISRWKSYSQASLTCRSVRQRRLQQRILESRLGCGEGFVHKAADLGAEPETLARPRRIRRC
jgi:hypothetical protein